MRRSCGPGNAVGTCIRRSITGRSTRMTHSLENTWKMLKKNIRIEMLALFNLLTKRYSDGNYYDK